MGQVIPMTLPPLRGKRSFTSAESLIEQVRVQIFKSGRPYKDIAADTKVAQSTIANLASGKTRWPRPTTLFPMLEALNMELALVPRRKGDG